MIITKTPFRMSFFGGGTDMEEFFRKHGGAVLSTTFDKYCYVTVRNLPPFFDYRTEIAYSIIERVMSEDEIQHPAVRNAMKMLDVHNIRLTYEADLPARSGLGSSSSFAAGMLNAFHKLKGEPINKRTLAEETIYLERQLCAESGGWQDQIAVVYGGMNRIDFDADGFYVRPIQVTSDRKKMLNENLMLFFTGFTRLSSEIQKINRITSDENTGRMLAMYRQVDDAETILTDESCSLDEFGRLLDSSWKLKRQTGSRISTSAIDVLYEKGMKAGALGGKLLGAGGGGFLLFYVPPENQAAVRQEMGGLIEVPFGFEEEGTTVIYD